MPALAILLPGGCLQRRPTLQCFSFLFANVDALLARLEGATWREIPQLSRPGLTEIHEDLQSGHYPTADLLNLGRWESPAVLRFRS
jgi:hypothetical protein